MQNHLELSKYHVIVLCLYIVVLPLLLFVLSPTLDYSFSFEKIIWQAVIITMTLGGFFVFYFHKKQTEPAVKPFKIIWIVLYAALFAISEEIFFRGIIQGYIDTHIESSLLTVLLSSVIYGAAHLLNEAKGFHPQHWNWKLALLTLTAGIPIGYLFVITESLLLPTLLHLILIVLLKVFIRKT